ncbi:MAG: hypothetical protein CMN30_06480 [Sandaracinus sp.]|nr:hypothetical protein [Sandaracinus sp.]
MISIAAREVGVLVGWTRGGWPSWTRLRSPRALEPDWTRTLGSGLHADPRCAVTWWGAGAPVALHGDLDGVRLVRGPDEHGRGALRAHLPGTAPWAFVPASDGLHVVTHRADGVFAGTLGAEAFTEHEAPVSPRRDVVALALHRVDPGYLLVLGLERALEVQRLDDAFRPLAAVRHPLRAPLAGLASAAVPGTVALALHYRGRPGADAALLDRDGRMRERPHPVLDEALLDVSTHWDEHGFRVSGRREDGALRSRRLKAGYAPQTLMEGVDAPYAITHVYGQTLVATVQLDELTLRVREGDGLVRPATVRVRPDDLERTRRIEAARAIGARWERLRTRGGYRGDGGAMRWDPQTLESLFPATDSSRGLRVRFEVDPPRLVLVLGEPGMAAPDASWARLLAWVKHRLTPTGRARFAAALATLEQVIGAELPAGARLEPLGDAILLELPLDEPPSAETLDSWARELTRVRTPDAPR